MGFFCLVYAMPLCASVYVCFVVTSWERADLLALVCGVLLWVRHFPFGILGQVWYLIVSIPDLCTLTYFAIIVLQMYCYYKCFVALPHGAVVWSAVCDCGIFLIILDYFFETAYFAFIV